MRTEDSTAPPHVVCFDVFELDPRAGELHKRGRKVRLQDKPFRILERLVERPGEIVTREELSRTLWPADTFVDFDAGLNTAVNKVRAALGDSAETPRFIETVGRRGYRFIGEVGERATPAEPGPVGQPRTARRALWITVGLAFAATASWWMLAPRAAPRIRSLAVLPLANLSGDPSQDYFADGMTEALITNLAGIQSLRVISRQSVMRYKGSTRPLPEIARELNVDGVIEGSVLREGARVRVVAQLLDAADDRHLWARTYERDLGGVLGLQAEVASAIAAEVQAHVTSQEKDRLSEARAVSPEAYDAYLRGRFFWSRRDEQGLTKAVEYFEQAIAADPGFAPAYAGLAEAYGPLGFSGFLPPSVATPRMKAAALKALELDPASPQAHTALAACLAFHEWNWVEGEKAFRRAIELGPGYPTSHLWYGLYLAEMGRVEEALREREIAFRSDPLAPNLGAALADSLVDVGRLDDAIDRYRRVLELEPRYFRARLGLARAYEGKGLREQALGELREADALSGGHAITRGPLARAYARGGQEAEARKVLGELTERSKTRHVPPMEIAAIHAALGEKDRAFEWLEKAYAERAPALSLIKTTSMLDSLRSDPRFPALLQRLHLE